jgi:hypothetical protein
MTSARAWPLVLLASIKALGYIASPPLIHPFRVPAFPAVPTAGEIVRLPGFRVCAHEWKETPDARDIYAFPNDINAI